MRLHWRVSYRGLGACYIIASSDVPENDAIKNFLKSQGIDYTAKNGIASIFQTVGKVEKPDCIHLFKPSGDAEAAMNEMIEKLDKLNGQKHDERIIHL